MNNNTMKYTTKLAIPFFTLFVGFTQLNAQQEPIYTQLDNALQFFNPAITGLNYQIQTTALARAQWVNGNGTPESQLINYSMRIKPLHGGIGINYFHETIGFVEYNRVKLNYAYHLAEFQGGQLSIGLSAGINNMKFTPTWTPPTTVTDPTLPTSSNDTRFTSDLGLVYKNNKLSVGLSVIQLNQASYSSGYRDKLHTFAYADYLFNLTSNWNLKPQVMISTDFNQVSTVMNVVAQLKNKFQFGVGYRSYESIDAIVGWDILEKYRIRYSYDLSIHSLSSNSNGSHEICIGLLLK
jgi:type IX secretion system PorP/SprF family membrane protein